MGAEERDSSEYIHNIGNLTLLHPKDNKTAGNEKFETKCEKIYKKSKLTLNTLILQYTTFPNDPRGAVQKRSEDLADKALEIFKVSLSLK